jgi:hypothetical protein
MERMNNMDTKTLHERITEKYAWPGGYPLYLVMLDGESMCCDCARKNWKLIKDAARTDGYLERAWIPVGVTVNWEDTELYCVHCGEKIESAYGGENEDIH